MDVLSGQYQPGIIHYYQGLPGGGYAAGVTLPEAPAQEGFTMSCTNAADFDGDGDLDLLIGDVKGAVYLNRNSGSKTAFQFGAREPLLADGKPLRVCQKSDPLPVDWDRDGKLDLLVGDEAGDLTFFRGLGDGAFDAGISLWTGLRHANPGFAAVRKSLGENPLVPGYRLRLATGDWNADGRLDLLVGNCEETKEGGVTGFVRVFLREAD